MLDSQLAIKKKDGQTDFSHLAKRNSMTLAFGAVMVTPKSKNDDVPQFI